MLKKIFIFVCLCSNTVFASAPITHAYLAKLWLEKSNKKTTELDKEFLLGALYPDIRRVVDIPREKTHEMGITKKDIKNAKTRFLSGCKLHSFIDEVRDKFLTTPHG